MKSATIIFPHQLFSPHPALEKERVTYLIEDPYFFDRLNFHKQKVAYHRVTMRAYAEKLSKSGYTVQYIEYEPKLNWSEQVKEKELHLCDPIEFALKKAVDRLSDREVVYYDSPMFLSTPSQLKEDLPQDKHLLMGRFYREQRKRMNILMKGDNPVGGKWSFDESNRKKFPIDGDLDPLKLKKASLSEKDQAFIETHFGDHPGELSYVYYPTTRRASLIWLNQFLEKRFASFGDYQDAISARDPFLFHAVLTPMLNIGLITPQDIVDRMLAYAKKNRIPINALEGFIRQVIGWREFMYGVYMTRGKALEKENVWKFSRKIPTSFWTGKTGIDPVDDVIEKVQDYAYAHHIERLMVVGNFMMLCEFKPKDVYRWFSELFIDAYDWVMIPNVYGMSQVSDGGGIVTKPYISSSNYVRKMSDYKKGHWSEMWDGLYWRFVYEHRARLGTYPRFSFILRQLARMDKDKLKAHRKVAKKFLAEL